MSNPHQQRARLGLGPAPGAMPPTPMSQPGLQQPTFQPAFQHPQHFGFQPYSYPGGRPVPGIADQYHAAGLGMNVPLYPQPYGAAPQPWGYGQNAAGGFPDAGGFLNAVGGLPNLGGFHNLGGIPNQGGTANVGGIPNPVPQPIVDKPEATRAVTQPEDPPTKTYPNRQVRKGGTSHSAEHNLPLTPSKSGSLRLQSSMLRRHGSSMH